MVASIGLPLWRAAREMVISQPFGENPQAYARFGLRGHNGIDFEAEEGELVVAVDDGEVVEVRFDAAGYGVTVKLAHTWGESRYAHGQPRSVPIDFELGRTVRRGERIFLAGSSGGCPEPHLHFGLRTLRESPELDYSDAYGFGGYADPFPFLRVALDLPLALDAATGHQADGGDSLIQTSPARGRGASSAAKARTAAASVAGAAGTSTVVRRK